MTENEFFTLLNTLPLEKIEQIHTKILLRIKAKEQAQQLAQEKQAKRPNKKRSGTQGFPTSYSDVNQMADNIGLDLSSLMREISKR